MKQILSALCILFSFAVSEAQNYVTPVRSDITPPSPQSASIVAVQNPAPDLLTGAVNLTVPIYTVSAGSVELPISLTYHTNGIKVFDDPAPVGYGWTLMPALRATRTVMGRPDEHYKFSGDPDNYSDPQATRFMCVAKPNVPSSYFKERLDPDHDVFSFALPGKTITRVLDNENGKLEFIGAGDTEYKVSADSTLTTIIVTDPFANKYIFGGNYEFYYEDGGIFVPTAWALKQIVLDNGDTINLNWSVVAHPFATRNWIGGCSFMDSTILEHWFNSGLDVGDMVTDNLKEAVFSRCNESNTFLRLNHIAFKGGTVNFRYNSTHIGSSLTCIEVRNETSIIRNFILSYFDDDYVLLRKIDGGEGHQYSFEYNTDFGLSPFSSWTGRHAQDWWGYYNAKENQSLTPDLGIKYYNNSVNTDGPYRHGYGNADRTVNKEAMQALILKQVTWPTGGTSSFVYEPHRFAPTRMESNGEIDSITDPFLSVGGGLRVKEITTTSGTGDNHPLTVRYEYPLARVRAVPSAATFMEVNTGVMQKPNAYFLDTYPLTFIRMVNIMPVSDYLKYDTGAMPLWYDKVTEYWPEGKIETYFSDMFEDMDSNRPQSSFGKRRPNNNQIRVFNGSPVTTKQIVYKSDGASFLPVEQTSYSYKRLYGSSAVTGYHVERNLINLVEEDYSTPDFVDGRLIVNHRFTVENAYTSYAYAVCPYYWNLESQTRTVYTDTGDSIVSSQSFTYYRHTELLESVTSTTSEGHRQTVSIAYPSADNGGWQAQMAAANVVGVPVHEKISNGSATTDISAEYIRTGSGAFRQFRTSTVVGNSTDTIFSAICQYDRYGRLLKVTDSDGLSVDWAWDSRGLYPVSKNNNGLLTTFSYKDLIGLSSSVSPAGIKTVYEYDDLGRLVKSGVNGLGALQSFAYTFGAGNNSVTATTWLDSDRSHSVTENYDNLGRKISSVDNATGLKQSFIYDAMGRCTGVSVPSTEPAVSSYDYNITAYEASPRGRAIATVRNGEAWHSGGHSVSSRLLTNDLDGLSCPRYSVSASGGLKMEGNYSPRTLTIDETTDEQGHVVRTYTTLSGLTVMKEEGDGTDDMLRTRYVYDDYGRLRFILPPSFEDVPGVVSLTDADFINNCYEFGYDGAGRQDASRTPGSSAWNRQVFSRAGRLVAEHTAPMGEGEWLVHFYDKHGRLVYTSNSGLIDTDLESLRRTFTVARFVGPTKAEYGGYALEPLPDFPYDNPYTASYFDDYSFRSLDSEGRIPELTGPATGLQTGAADFSSGSARFSAIGYDAFGRVTKEYGQTFKGLLATDLTLDRAGNPLTAVTSLTTGSTTRTRTQSFGYDSAGRVISRSVAFGDRSADVAITYGPMGGVAKETFSNHVVRSYSYDCHGWVTDIKTSLPMFRIPGGKNPTITPGVTGQFYGDALGEGFVGEVVPAIYTDYTEQIIYESGVNPRWDGTASARVTSLGGRYDYGFDAHDRLVTAAFTPGADAPEEEDFSAAYTYNSVGAPLTVTRRGVRAVADVRGERISEGYGVVDRLAYRWNGMLLAEVDAAENGEEFVGRTGFPLSGAGGGTASYSWTAAGLLKTDSARGISNTLYNRLGLPTSVTFADKSRVDFRYGASGELLTVSTYAVVEGSKRPVKVSERSYCGDFVFEGDSLLSVEFTGGYFDGDGNPHFRHADWQGNVAMVTDGDGSLEQHVGYYPYGEPWREPVGQSRLFGGKERLRDGALNDYDFKARRLNSALGIWSSPDPLARDFAQTNPYVYCAANPIRFIDPSGKKGQLSVTSNAFVISANFYLPEYASDSFKYGITQLNELSQGITIIDETNGKEYALKFQLRENIKEIPDRYTTMQGLNFTISNDEIGNGYDVVNSFKSRSDGNINAGRTTNREYVEVAKKRSTTNTVVHEILHALGFDHSDSGVMFKFTNDSKKENYLDLNALLRDLKEILINGDSKTIKTNIPDDINIDIENLKIKKN